MTNYLYHTTVPVLLDGKGKAGRIALELYRQHRLTSHWFGCGGSLLTVTYTQKHPLPCEFSRLSDGILTQILLDFARAQEGKLLVLIPCSSAAREYVCRTAETLECGFVLLSTPTESERFFALPAPESPYTI